MSGARRALALYAAWILVCAALFLAFSGASDPSRRRDRMLSNDAGRRALSVLRQSDPARFRDYEVVHVAYARRGEGGDLARWVVLCDRVPHTALRQAVVVEIEAASGALIVMRRPLL